MTRDEIIQATIPVSDDDFRARALRNVGVFAGMLDQLIQPALGHGYAFDTRTREALMQLLAQISALVETGPLEYDDKRHQVALFAIGRPSQPEGEEAMSILRSFAIASSEDAA